MAVAAYEIAHEINPTKDFLTRSNRVHARFKHRPLSSENAAHFGLHSAKKTRMVKHSYKLTEKKSSLSGSSTPNVFLLDLPNFAKSFPLKMHWVRVGAAGDISILLKSIFFKLEAKKRKFLKKKNVNVLR